MFFLILIIWICNHERAHFKRICKEFISKHKLILVKNFVQLHVRSVFFSLVQYLQGCIFSHLIRVLWSRSKFSNLFLLRHLRSTRNCWVRVILWFVKVLSQILWKVYFRWLIFDPAGNTRTNFTFTNYFRELSTLLDWLCLELLLLFSEHYALSIYFYL